MEERRKSPAFRREGGRQLGGLIMAEKIYKREDGSQVKLNIYFNRYSSGKIYSMVLYHRAPQKRKWIILDHSNYYSYRRLSTEEKKDYNLKSILSYVTLEEIYEVQMMCWNEIKPDINNILNEVVL